MVVVATAATEDAEATAVATAATVVAETASKQNNKKKLQHA